jgi:Zn-dependent protease
MFFMGSFKLTKIFGIDIELDYSWLIIFFLVVWTLSAGFFPMNFPQFTQTTNIVLGFITSIAFFGSVVFHELAHSLVAKRNNIPINKITLFLFGGAAQISEEPKTAAVEFKMAIAGPASSLFLSAIFFLAFNLVPLSPQNEVFLAPLIFLANVNLILAIFNMIPGFPMDGGRVLRAIFWFINKDFLKSTKIAAAGGQIVAFLLIGGGISLILLVSDFSGIWMILIGFFLRSAAVNSLRQVKIKSILEEIKVELLMEKPTVVSWNTISADIIDEYAPKEKTTIFLVEKAGKPVGSIDIKNIQKLSNHEKEITPVYNIMKPIGPSESVTQHDSAIKALKIMEKENMPKIPVIDKLNRITGMITERSLDYYLSVNLNT